MQTAEGLYYTDSLGGNGTEPVVLIHGIGGSHLCWPAAMRKMSGKRTIAIDLPGHGRSEGIASRSAGEYTRSLTRVLKSAGIYRALFVGYSLGAQVAAEFCADHPDQCAGLGLIACGTAPVVPDALLDMLNDAAAEPVLTRMIRKLFFSPDTPPSRQEELEKILFSARKSTLAADWHAFAEFICPNLEERIPPIPVWVCMARDDRLFPMPVSRLPLCRRSHTTCDRIDHCGHGILVEQPDKVSQAFLDWLSAK